MRIISFNVRGLGGRLKKWVVKELIVKEKAEFVCLQESKLEYVDERVASMIWGNKKCDWVFSGSVGAAGGLVCVWDNEVFTRQSLWGEKGLLGVSGLWEGVYVNIVNVYVTSKVEERREVWEALIERMRGKEDERWCICGDFNTIRREEERRGSDSGDRKKEMMEFNDLINQLRLVDLPLERRKFTWYRDNGKSCSRLDHFLLSDEWIARWPNLVQLGLRRKISDHAAIFLKEEVVDWGPKPFKFVNGWLKEKGFREMVEEVWRGNEIKGWKGYVIKEKLKLVKEKNQGVAKEQLQQHR